MTLKSGWLQRQCDQVERDVQEWPAWMRRAAGLEPKEPAMFHDDTVKHAVEAAHRDWKAECARIESTLVKRLQEAETLLKTAMLTIRATEPSIVVVDMISAFLTSRS